MRAELKAARDQLATIDGEEAEALENSAKFAAWSQKRAALVGEVDRLERLTTVTENTAAEATKSEVDAAARREIAAARKTAADLATRSWRRTPRHRRLMLGGSTKTCSAARRR